MAPPGSTAYERWFRAVEEMMGTVGGRPHWGKLHGLDAATLEQRYPRHADMAALRKQVDPDGVFATGYLDRVLGEPVRDRDNSPSRRSGR